MPIGNAARLSAMAGCARNNGETPAEAIDPNPAETPPEGPEQTGSRFGNSVRHLTTTMTLGYVSAMAVAAEYSGKTADLPEIPSMIASSSAHPLLGYVGAWGASVAAHNKPTGVRVGAMLALATAANFITEKAQSAIIASPQYVDFLSSRNLPETAKDYAFSLLGVGLFMLQNRRPES